VQTCWWQLNHKVTLNYFLKNSDVCKKTQYLSILFRELNRLVNNRKAELESVMREDSLIGETRIVWGCGGEGKVLLFSGDYIGINIRNVPKTWSLVDLDFTLRRKLSQQMKVSICNLFFLAKSDDQSKKSARVIFNSPLIAAAAIKVSYFRFCLIIFLIYFIHYFLTGTVK